MPLPRRKRRRGCCQAGERQAPAKASGGRASELHRRIALGFRGGGSSGQGRRPNSPRRAPCIGPVHGLCRLPERRGRSDRTVRRSSRSPRGQHYFQQVALTCMEAGKPFRTFFQRANRRNQRLDLHGAAGKQLNGARILTRRSATPLKADLAANDLLQRQADARRDVSNKPDVPPFSDTVNREIYGAFLSHRFHRGVNAETVRKRTELLGKMLARRKYLLGPEASGKRQPRLVDIGDKYRGTSRGPQTLEQEEPDHSRSNDEYGRSR